MDYLKIGKATDLTNKRDYRLYRALEILPGFLSLGTLLILVILSYFAPVIVAFFMIAFDVYWLLLVIFLAVYLISGYSELRKFKTHNWEEMTRNLRLNFSETNLSPEEIKKTPLCDSGMAWTDLWQLIVLPTYNESLGVLRSCLDSLLADGFPVERMIVVMSFEARAGAEAVERERTINFEYQGKFGHFLTTIHPDGIPGELKAKGANQAHAAKVVKEKIIDVENIPYDKILVSVFDVDTIVVPGYFFKLTYTFLTVPNPYHASYQPVPLYHNNVWQSPFFARVASSSNTFWQIMQQIRPEKLSTYSSHSMTFKALVDIGFWSTNMVSEDSRIFFNCLLFYNGDYRVEPLHFPILMDTTMDKNFKLTAMSLYKQQRRWAWGAENLPYLIFNSIKRWQQSDKKTLARHIFVQTYGFHSWATSALIIGVIGWLPTLIGGDRFNSTVLSGNLPIVSTWLMNLALIGLIQSAIISNMLLPKRPVSFTFWRRALLVLEWVFVPVSIIIFGAIPCLDAQIRLMLGKYMGFFVTPKERG